MKKKNEVKEYEPPIEIANIAEKRSMDIYRQWAWNPRNDIRKLIVSLYMQGMNDAIDTII